LISNDWRVVRPIGLGRILPKFKHPWLTSLDKAMHRAHNHRDQRLRFEDLVWDPVNLSLTRSLILLAIVLLIDIIGYASYVFPIIGELGDIPWAPFSAYVLHRLFPSAPSSLKFLQLLEEWSPGLDFIPTATITWINVHYVIFKDKVE
jgi:hypothetical protein